MVMLSCEGGDGTVARAGEIRRWRIVDSCEEGSRVRLSSWLWAVSWP